MKASKYREIDTADLTRQVQDTQEQLFRLRFQMGMGQSEGLKKYRNLKKDRARMLTILTEKGGNGAAAAAGAAAANPAEKKNKKK
jgi:large subunit ribosomal protein L29